VETIAGVGLWPALVDANQLENALLNLCINARDAMPDGGKLTIETGNKWLDQRAARERGMEAGQYVTVTVSDTGTGIDKAILARVFDPFFTTKPMGQGTGLGLSMVYGFARQSNGHVRIYSEVGKGTTVCIYLPRHHGEESVDEQDNVAISPHTEASETVLVIDDEPTVRMLICDALADLGYACVEAADGATGLKILQSKDKIDLLISDVGLPGGLNGRQVADAARALRPELKVLFITGYAENAALNHGHIERGMEVLTKPFAVDELAARVERILREGRA
jgi:CheY-like chemotaxis protein